MYEHVKQVDMKYNVCELLLKPAGIKLTTLKFGMNYMKDLRYCGLTNGLQLPRKIHENIQNVPVKICGRLLSCLYHVTTTI